MTPQTLIAVDPDRLDALTSELKRLHDRLDRVEMTPKPEWVTAHEYADQVNRSTDTVNKWAKTGKVETKFVGAVRMFRSV